MMKRIRSNLLKLLIIFYNPFGYGNCFKLIEVIIVSESFFQMLRGIHRAMMIIERFPNWFCSRQLCECFHSKFCFIIISFSSNFSNNFNLNQQHRKTSSPNTAKHWKASTTFNRAFDMEISHKAGPKMLSLIFSFPLVDFPICGKLFLIKTSSNGNFITQTVNNDIMLRHNIVWQSPAMEQIALPFDT